MVLETHSPFVCAVREGWEEVFVRVFPTKISHTHTDTHTHTHTRARTHTHTNVPQSVCASGISQVGPPRSCRLAGRVFCSIVEFELVPRHATQCSLFCSFFANLHRSVPTTHDEGVDEHDRVALQHGAVDDLQGVLKHLKIIAELKRRDVPPVLKLQQEIRNNY